MRIKNCFIRILQYLKYKNTKFKKVDNGCNFKALSSNFLKSEKISLGDNVWIGKGADFDDAGGIEIGNGVIMAPEVVIYSRTHNFNSNDLKALPFDNIMLIALVVIKDYVWIGRRAMIMPGVTIGKGGVVGGGAVVSKDVPDYAVVVGNPAKVVKYRNKEIFEKLSNEKEPFVYNKLKHKKEIRQK